MIYNVKNGNLKNKNRNQLIFQEIYKYTNQQ